MKIIVDLNMPADLTEQQKNKLKVEVADAIQRLADAHGANSVAVSVEETWHFWDRPPEQV